MTRRRKWAIWGSLILIPTMGAAAYLGMLYFNVFHAHEHCIVQTGSAFQNYASDHQGKLPYSTNGFGSALLLLVQGDYLGDSNRASALQLLTGPGDDGHAFGEALRTGEPVPENECSRIYFQGLSQTNNNEIAILWDKKSTPGGDHARRPWGPLLREVCLLDGSRRVILDKDWAAFSSNQVDLLVREGIPRATAQHYYDLR